MLFLVDYERETGRLISLREFASRDREAAEEARLELELALARSGGEREVVLLEADDQAALRLTHRRYFENVAQLANEVSPLQ